MAKCAVVWIHGLGDTGDGWRGAAPFQAVAKKRNVTFHHPTAPQRAVTCNGGMRMTSWFDIVDIPLVPSEPENPKDMDQTVKYVHDMLADIESKGVPAENIILGGFSQGGATSLLAGLSYPKKLAGIISISGWCVNRANVSSWISEQGKHTPVLMGCGDGDPVVDFSITKLSADLIKEVVGDKIEIMCPRRPMHQPDSGEISRMASFMIEHLPE